MFRDYWCEKCGEKIASNLYRQGPDDMVGGTGLTATEHWRWLVNTKKAEHECSK